MIRVLVGIAATRAARTVDLCLRIGADIRWRYSELQEERQVDVCFSEKSFNLTPDPALDRVLVHIGGVVGVESSVLQVILHHQLVSVCARTTCKQNSERIIKLGEGERRTWHRMMYGVVEKVLEGVQED